MEFRAPTAALLALALLCGCTKVSTENAAQTVGGGRAGNPWTHPDRLIFGEAQDLKSLDPMLATSAPALDLSMFVFSYAVRYDERSQPHPDALRELPTVENGDVSKDGLTLKYRLRPADVRGPRVHPRSGDEPQEQRHNAGRLQGHRLDRL
jgi:ABC-type transport system substrate-binding protein